MLKKCILLIGQILSPKTLYFNFKYLPFHQAVKLPFFIRYNTCLLKTGGSVSIEGPVKTGMIKIGFGKVGIFDKRKLRAIWEVRGHVHFSGNALLKFGSKISVGKKGVLTIGKNFRLSTNGKIVCFLKVKIGHNVRISWETIVMDTDFHKIMTMDGNRINYPKKIIIGNNVWIGMRVTILKGAVIKDNNIIASNSVLSKPVDESFCVIGGHPARVLSRDCTWEA